MQCAFTHLFDCDISEDVLYRLGVTIGVSVHEVSIFLEICRPERTHSRDFDRLSHLN